MDRVLLSRSLATVSAILAVAVPAVGGVVVSEHSHVENSISELGAVGTHWGRLISWGGFLPTGIIGIGLMVFAGTYFKRRPDKIALATPALGPWHGSIQWVGEVALFGALVLIGWRLTRSERAAGAG